MDEPEPTGDQDVERDSVCDDPGHRDPADHGCCHAVCAIALMPGEPCTEPDSKVPGSLRHLGQAFGRIAALDGWSLERARSLGKLTGYDEADVEAGFQSARRP